MRAARATKGAGFSIAEPLRRMVAPENLGDWTTIVSVVAFGVICGLAVAALAAARRGVQRHSSSILG
jgi:hypothetical protein